MTREENEKKTWVNIHPSWGVVWALGGLGAMSGAMAKSKGGGVAVSGSRRVPLGCGWVWARDRDCAPTLAFELGAYQPYQASYAAPPP